MKLKPTFTALARWALLLALIVTLAPAAAPNPRGGRVGWARLQTPASDWAIHRDRDAELAEFIRARTSLNLEPDWDSVAPGDLEQLCLYPFIYAKDLVSVRNPRDLRNLQEYFRRGGFVCIDPCTARMSAAESAAYPIKYGEWFARLVPGSVLRELPDDHPVYHCCFSVGVGDLFTNDMVRLGATRPPHLGMYGVFVGERMLALISLSGLECGWPQTPQRAPGCMQMIVNAYVYAMTRTEAPLDPVGK